MANIGSRWESYQPSKAVWFWSCAACVAATIVVGFTWGNWVTGGTATRMASDAANGAQAHMASASCVTRFNQGPDAVAQLAALKKAASYERGDIIQKGGWVTMPGDTNAVAGAADICAQTLMTEKLPPAAKG
jgi:GH24 family phage-related lysozyme (muramidase)